MSRTAHPGENPGRPPARGREVFSFFADPRNLEAITPAFPAFLDPAAGARGRSTWTPASTTGSRCSGSRSAGGPGSPPGSPGVRFVDVQERGPYALWHHTHTFADEGSGTRVSDRVEYRLPLGPLGEVAHPVLVRRTLARIFDHRQERVAALLGTAPGIRRAA